MVKHLSHVDSYHGDGGPKPWHLRKVGVGEGLLLYSTCVLVGSNVAV